MDAAFRDIELAQNNDVAMIRRNIICKCDHDLQVSNFW